MCARHTDEYKQSIYKSKYTPDVTYLYLLHARSRCVSHARRFLILPGTYFWPSHTHTHNTNSSTNISITLLFRTFARCRIVREFFGDSRCCWWTRTRAIVAVLSPTISTNFDRVLRIHYTQQTFAYIFHFDSFLLFSALFCALSHSFFRIVQNPCVNEMERERDWASNAMRKKRIK